MAENKMQTFTFNRPITLIFSVSLVLIMLMCVYGLTVEFRLSLVVMLLVTGGVVSMLLYLGFLRRLKIGKDHATWITPKRRFEMALSDVRYFGVVKFRSFRFIYFSKAETQPFEDPQSPVVPDEDTFLIQYRHKAWSAVSQSIGRIHPTLKPQSITRQ